MDLSASETRVLGCLLEKQRTTPDMYPLTLNALRLACNQSTNRDPVVDYDDGVIRDALHHLERRGYVRLASGPGSRAPKYRHLLAEALPMSSAEQAVMCVLMLRGAQTPGELKQRTERMHAFADLDGVHETLERLIARELAARLERRPGQKEERYTQLLEDREAGAERFHGTHAAAPVSGSDAYAQRARPEPQGEGTGAGGRGAVGARAQDGEAAAGARVDGGEASAALLVALERRVEQLELQVAELRSELPLREPAGMQQ